MAQRVTVLVAAGGADWETHVLAQLADSGPHIVLLRRCVDLNDLLAHASTGQAAVALVADTLSGLDADSVSALHRAKIAVLVVARAETLTAAAEQRLDRIGVDRVLPAGSLEDLAQVLVDTRSEAPREPDLGLPSPDTHEDPPGRGRLVAVWGPNGAPGRTTVAVGIAAELGRRGRGAFLLDIDPYGGAVAQHLGVLDEASGVLAAVRLANAGGLDMERLAGVSRQVDPGLRVLTGLPRADRWVEVRDRAFEQLLDAAVGLESVVVADAGFSLESDLSDPFGGPAPRRNGMTLLALEQADEVIVVGSADPVGLARLARGLVELLEIVPGRPVRVVVNRVRPSLGWGERDVRAMIEGFVTPLSVHFLPDDRAGADRALVAGKSLVEVGDSVLRRAVARLADALVGEAAGTQRPRRGLRKVR